MLFDSLPIALPISSIDSRSHVEDKEEALGKHAAEAPEAESPRAPMGPSVIFILGIDNLSTPVECQASEPEMIETFSSKVNSLIKASILSIELMTLRFSFHIRRVLRL